MSNSEGLRAMSRGLLAILFVMASLLGLCGCQAERETQTADLIDIDTIKTQEVRYETAQAAYGHLERPTGGQASIDYPGATPLFFKESGGRLKGIYTSNSMHVKKGDLLAEISFDDGSLGALIEEKRIAYQNEINNLEAEKNRRQAEMNAMESNTGQGKTQAYDERLLQLQVRRAQDDYRFYEYDARRRIEKCRTELAELEEKYAGEKIVAPFDGVVTNVSVYMPGKLIEPGEWMMVIYDEKDIEIKFTGDKGVFRYNMDVNVVVPRVGEFPARIVSDPSAVDNMDGQLSYRVGLLDMPEDYMDIRSKIVSISIDAKAYELENALLIPAKAVRNEDSKKYVLILENNVVKKRYVQVGLFTTDLIQILTGVEPGDLVILN